MFSHSTWKCNRGCIAWNMTTDVQNSVPLHGHTPGDVSILSFALSTTVSCTPDQTALRCCCSCSFKCLKKSFKVVFLSFCCKLFYQYVSSKTFKLIQILKNKMWFSSQRPVSLISVVCYRRLQWKKSKLVPCFIKTRQLLTWRLKTLCRYAVPKIINID